MDPGNSPSANQAVDQSPRICPKAFSSSKGEVVRVHYLQCLSIRRSSSVGSQPPACLADLRMLREESLRSVRTTSTRDNDIGQGLVPSIASEEGQVPEMLGHRGLQSVEGLVSIRGIRIRNTQVLWKGTQSLRDARISGRVARRVVKGAKPWKRLSNPDCSRCG
jgi:hypothetical protein